jgi:hypothetical protein
MGGRTPQEHLARLRALRQAKEAQGAARGQSPIEAIQAYRASARAAFAGSDAEFTAAWPGMLIRWLRSKG